MVATQKTSLKQPLDATASSSLILLSLNSSIDTKTHETARILIYRFMTSLSVYVKSHPSLLITLGKLAQTFDAHADDLDRHLIHTATYLTNCAKAIKEHEATLIAPQTMHEKWQHTLQSITYWFHSFLYQLKAWATGKSQTSPHHQHRKQSPIEKAIGNIYLQIDELLNDQAFIDAMNAEIKAHQQTKQPQTNHAQKKHILASRHETPAQNSSLSMQRVFRKTTFLLQTQAKSSTTSYLSSINAAFFRAADTPDSIAMTETSDENEYGFYPIDPLEPIGQTPSM